MPVLPRGRATIERALKLLRPDVVHLHLPGPSPFGYDAARAARGMDLPLVITAYAGGPETFSKYAVRIAGWATAPVATSGVNSLVATQAAEVFGDGSPSVLPLGTELSLWVSAGAQWRKHQDLRVLVHGGDRAKWMDLGVDAALARVSDRVTVTESGPNVGALKGADTSLGDAPAEVFPALASEHDVYVSAAVLDPHAAGAAAAGMILIGAHNSGVVDLVGGGGVQGEPGARAGGFLVRTAEDTERAILKLAESSELRERMRAANLEESWAQELKRHDWVRVLDAADGLYADSRDRVRRYFSPEA